ncbi:MAG: hypothetical protein JWN34_2927 [Bryobacterales bacterium]|nr:hypothetical protein [Bryobacterales bacterium]
MKISTLRRSIGVAAFGLLLTGSNAFATTITQTFTVPGAGFNTTVWSNTYVIDKFDSTLGALNGVTVSLTNSVSGVVTVTNNSHDSGQFNASIQAESWFSLDSALLSQNGNNFDPELTSISLLADDVNAKTSPGFTIADGFGGTGSRTLTRTSPVYVAQNALTIEDQFGSNVFSGLSYFTTIGIGTFNVYELVAGKTGYLGPGPASSSGTPTSNTILSVVYSYTAAPPPSDTPEPASFILLGTALVGLGICRARRKA